MMQPHCTAWIFWDPPREAFTIPFINLTIVWYGVCFAASFVVAYFVLFHMFKCFIGQNKTIFLRDIENWKNLAIQFKQADLFSKLDKPLQQELEQLPNGTEPSITLKGGFLQALNQEKSDRKTLEETFPGTFTTAKDLATLFTDRLTWYIVIGMILGARLGHILFYDLPFFIAHPVEILMIRHGGLASHGGTVGVMIGLILFIYRNQKEFPDLTFLKLCDLLVVPTAFVSCCIRLGNFFNQEILGNETSLPWAIIFGHAADGSAPAPRHPVQLYEALIYLLTFFFLYGLWKFRGINLKAGVLTGLFFLIVFGSRFLIEFLKIPQSMLIDESFLQMGQYLSLPFIAFGIGLLCRAETNPQDTAHH